MRDLISSRGFWVGVAAVLGAVATEFPDVGGWCRIGIVIITAALGAGVVTIARRRAGKPTSYLEAEKVAEAKAATVELLRSERTTRQ